MKLTPTGWTVHKVFQVQGTFSALLVREDGKASAVGSGPFEDEAVVDASRHLSVGNIRTG